MYKFYVSKDYQKVFVPVNKNITVYFIIKNSTISYGFKIKVKAKKIKLNKEKDFAFMQNPKFNLF